MTWETFFDLSTMAHRHLVFVYVGVWIVQCAYLAWVGWNWRSTEKPRD
jgi:threonine/homoserine/homoserine lactone efflux protein